MALACRFQSSGIARFLPQVTAGADAEEGPDLKIRSLWSPGCRHKFRRHAGEEIVGKSTLGHNAYRRTSTCRGTRQALVRPRRSKSFPAASADRHIDFCRNHRRPVQFLCRRQPVPGGRFLSRSSGAVSGPLLASTSPASGHAIGADCSPPASATAWECGEWATPSRNLPDRYRGTASAPGALRQMSDERSLMRQYATASRQTGCTWHSRSFMAHLSSARIRPHGNISTTCWLCDLQVSLRRAGTDRRDLPTWAIPIPGGRQAPPRFEQAEAGAMSGPVKRMPIRVQALASGRPDAPGRRRGERLQAKVKTFTVILGVARAAAVDFFPLC